jgi:hypothetical protein
MKLPVQDGRRQDFGQEGEAVIEDFAGDEAPGDTLSISLDRSFSGHSENQIVRTLVSRQIMLDWGLKAQSQVPDIQFLDDHIRPRIEI